MHLRESILLFGIPTVWFFLVAWILIPSLNREGMHPALAWFLAGGGLVFLPLFLLAIALCRRDGYLLRSCADRLRLRPMDREDWLWTAGGVLAILLLMGIVMGLSGLAATLFGIGPIEPAPAFVRFEPFRGAGRFLLLAWLPMFFFNIVGEELLWRGYILPRQESAWGSRAWIANALLWTLFHLPFGPGPMIMLLPILLILPPIVQRRGNTTVGIAIHGIVNGPAFVAVSMGLM